MTESVIGFIGAGNMAQCLIRGLLVDNYSADKLWASAPHADSLAQLTQSSAINVTTDNLTVLDKADVIVFAVKPQILPSVLDELATAVDYEDKLFISIAAGVRVASIQAGLQIDTVPLVRCMPNTPALVGSGASALYANTRVTPRQKELAESILRAVGMTVWLDDENMLDTVTALSGSGPAYFFLMIEALIAAGCREGLTADTARLLVLQTALGAAKMALESTQEVAKLRTAVTSPGGTTAAGLQSLKDSDFVKVIYDAVKAAKQRSQQLAGENS